MVESALEFRIFLVALRIRTGIFDIWVESTDWDFRCLGGVYRLGFSIFVAGLI